MTYQLTILDKTATVDDYEKGEIGMGNNFYINETVKGDTIEAAIQKACDFVGGAWEGSDQCYSIDIDGDQGRIDFQTMEDADGNTATDTQLAAWRKGKQTLYACYYVGFVERLTPVNLEAHYRLEYLRGELKAERISYGELAELANLKQYIEPEDVELLEAAGVPEN